VLLTLHMLAQPDFPAEMRGQQPTRITF